jgi:hypothetical protein
MHRSNLLRTFTKITPTAEDSKEIELNEVNRLKEIIKKYFSSKEKMRTEENLLLIHEIEPSRGGL